MNATEIFSFVPGQPLLFSGGLFFVLFCAFYGAYALLYQRRLARTAWVLAFSMFFYYKSSGIFLFVLLALAVMDYALAARIHAEKSPALRRALLLFSLSGN